MEWKAASHDDALVEGPSLGWSVVLRSFVAFGIAFSILIATVASSLEISLLGVELLVMASAVWFSPRIGRSVALHIISGSFLLYQTIVLDVTRATPNLGVVWFLLVPTWATLWGRTRHVLIWVPATALAIGWTGMRADPSDPVWQHPLTMPNLIAVLAFSAAIALGFQRDRRHRERALKGTLRRLRDETRERHSAEERVRSAEHARHRLLAMLSHELRSPMTSLSLTADMLDANENDPSSLRRLEHSARATLRTLDDILDLVRLEDGVLPQRAEVFSLSELLADVSDVIGPQVDTDVVVFEIEVASDVVDRWTGDRARLRQVLLNVVGNAIKHTNEGSIRVEVTCDRAAASLGFAVQDTGVGIAPDVVADVFEPWRSGEDPRRVRGGVGLGLSISRDFVEAMGGTIRIARTGETGTRMEFRVCATPIDGVVSLERPVPEVRQPKGRPLHDRRVLVVDDDPTVRDVVARVLERAGASVVVAADGRDAETTLEGGEAFDLVVLDLEMPGRTGYDVLASIPSAVRPAVLVLSGSLEAEAEARDAGADAFAAKPVRASSLLELAASLARR